MRAMPSVLPPGANGMMILTGFCGQPSDYAGWVEPCVHHAVPSAADPCDYRILLHALIEAPVSF
jgi:hypothetical protein